MIEDKNICELTNETIGFILSNIDSRFAVSESNEMYNYKEILEESIEEVKERYINSIKKSIIDYILLDQTEMDRLNIYLRHKAPKLYGQTAFKYQNYD